MADGKIKHLFDKWVEERNQETEMGQHPHSAVWEANGGQQYRIPNRLSDEQCTFLNDNVGISRRTLRHVHIMFNKKFGTALRWETFMSLRADAIREGRARTTYFRNYFKNENSSERELRLQRPYLKSRLTGGCQYKPSSQHAACGAHTVGRYCEKHVHAAFAEEETAKRGVSYLDTSLGKYG